VNRARASVAAFAGAALLAATVGLGGSAGAASHDGLLASHGAGSLYSEEGEAVLAAVPGSSATYSVEVVNTGATLAQYQVKVVTYAGSDGTTPQVVTVTKGSTVVTALATGPDGYYTAPIAPGKVEILTVKVAVPKGLSKRDLNTSVELLAGDGTHLAWTSLVTEVPGTGSSVSDIYARQGSQPYVGPYQTASSPAVAKGSTVTFNLKVQNDGTTTQAVGIFRDREQPTCGTWTIKDGSTDITSRFYDDGSTIRGYPTPTLKPGASKVLSVIYKRTAGAGCGTGEYLSFSTLYGFFEGGESVQLFVPMAR